MRKINISEFPSILNLLHDPDERTFELLEPQLYNQNEDFYQKLDKEYKHTNEEILKVRLEKIFYNRNYKKILDAFRNLPFDENGDLKLESAVMLLAKTEYPNLDEYKYTKTLDEMAEQLSKILLPTIKDPLLVIEIINEYFFSELGFRGNDSNYLDPDNSYINKVIERKTGIPITLSVLYLLITNRLGLPFYGVGMPGHFIVMYKQGNFEVFTDPFNQGRLLTRNDCINFLNYSGYGFLERYLHPTSNRDILCRMVRNLLLVYRENNNPEKSQYLREVLDIIETNY